MSTEIIAVQAPSKLFMLQDKVCSFDLHWTTLIELAVYKNGDRVYFMYLY